MMMAIACIQLVIIDSIAVEVELSELINFSLARTGGVNRRVRNQGGLVLPEVVLSGYRNDLCFEIARPRHTNLPQSMRQAIRHVFM